MEIGEFPGRREQCIDRDERAAKGDADDGGMDRGDGDGSVGDDPGGMLRGLRVDARCLATFPQHPS